ncbi:MAG: hypothetical protein U0L04_07240, partial [Bacteroidaceae bacterium]|nr:hypothetical protein [Bacteroidaceae bacterium]
DHYDRKTTKQPKAQEKKKKTLLISECRYFLLFSFYECKPLHKAGADKQSRESGHRFLGFWSWWAVV